MSSQASAAGMAVFSILLYCTISIAIVYVNYLLFTDTLKFPVFVTWFQQAVGTLFFILMGTIGQKFAAFSKFPKYQIKWDILKVVLPVTLSFVASIALANICLKYVLVSTYQVARSLTLLFNVVLSYVVLGQKSSLACLGACGLIFAGFVVGSLDGATLSVLGLTLGGMSSFFQAINAVQVKKALAAVNNDQNVLLTYNLTISTFLFVPIIFIAGEQDVLDKLPFDVNQANFLPVWGGLMASATLGLLVNVATVMSIKYTSPLTHNIVGYVKSCVQSLGGVIFFGDIVTVFSATSIALTLLGSIVYSQVRMRENAAAAAEAAKSKQHAADDESFPLKGLGAKTPGSCKARTPRRDLDPTGRRMV